MTLPHEKIWSIQRTRQFLRDLQDPKKTPRISSAIRKEAGSCLRHYPWSIEEEVMLYGFEELQCVNGKIEKRNNG